MSFSLWEALLIGILNWLGYCEIMVIHAAVQQPLFLGLVFGLVYGDVPQGMIVGATLNLYYIGNIALGGTAIQDQTFGCCMAIPLALKTGMDPATALALAIPFGLLAGTLDSFRRLINGRFNAPVNKAIDELNYKKISFYGCFLPGLVQFLIRFTMAFVVILFLGDSLTTAVENLPVWLTEGISAIGGMLPALGLIMCATIIGQPSLIPFFFLGFIGMSLTGLSSMTMAIIAALIAIIYINCASEFSGVESTGSMFRTGEEAGPRISNLTKRDHFMCGLRVYLLHRLSNSLEFLYGSSYVVAVMPALRKIYGNNTEGLKEALHRHAMPYMTEQAWGECITGAALAMEEEIAAGNKEVTGSQIVTLKSSLMGPLAGFGDTILWVTLWPICQALVIPFALQGQWWPAFWAPVYLIFFVGMIYYPTHMIGYRTGRKSVIQLLKSGTMKKFMAAAGVLGMVMMGALSASYTHVATPLVFTINPGTISETKIVLQDILDGLVPNLLALVYTAVSFFYIYKGGKYLRLVLATIVLGLLGSVVGIF